MKITLIVLGAGAGCLLMAGSALAGPCSAQIAALSKQLEASDAGMGPTANGSVGTGTMNQSAVGPSAEPKSTTHAPTGAMNEASQNKATSAQDVQNQNAGMGTMADQSSNGVAATTSGGNQGALIALEQARRLDQAGDQSACMDQVMKAQELLSQP